MSAIIVAGNTSGSVTLDAPAVAGTTVITLPTTSGTMVATDASGNVGIGTTSPNYKITIGGQTGATATPLGLRFSNDFSNVNTASASKVFLYNDGTTGNIYGIGVGSAGDVQYHAGSTGLSSGNHRWFTNDVERMRLDASGNLQFNSGYGSVATAYGCRAWVNFNGTGTVAIRASGNVSSITDSGVGLYIVNLTNAMPDANYSYALDSKLAATGTGNLNEGATLNSALATTSLSIRTGSKAANTAADHALVTCEVFR